MKFLTPGEKIKKMRKQFNMVQQEFEEDFMTRSYFGMIEAGKRNINERIAVSIAEKFTKKAKTLGVDLHISPEYLMMSPQEEARQYCEDKLAKELAEQEIYDIIEIAKEYEVPEVEMKAYKKVGEMYHSNYKYLDAFIAFSNALDIAKNIDEKYIQAYLFNKLGACKYANMEFIEALVYFEKANSYAVIYKDEKTEINSLLNMAMGYRRLSMYDKAINYANMCLSKINYQLNNDIYTYANMIKFNSYMDKGDYEKALELSDQMINFIEDKKGKDAGFILNNMANVYLEMGEMNKSMDYFNMSQEIRREQDPAKLSHTIIDKSRAYIKQGLNVEATMLLQLGIDMTIKYNDQDYLLRAYYHLIEVYSSLEDYDNVEKTYLKVIDILREKDNTELLRVYLEISRFYVKLGNLEQAEKYIELSQRTIAKGY